MAVDDQLGDIFDVVDDYRTQLMVYGLGLFALAAGASKFVAPAVWGKYTPGWFLELVPLTGVEWMYAVGVIEAAAGILVLSRWKTHVWALVISLWLIGVAGAVTTAGFYDIAFRDVGLALFAFVTALEAYQTRQD